MVVIFFANQVLTASANFPTTPIEHRYVEGLNHNYEPVAKDFDNPASPSSILYGPQLDPGSTWPNWGPFGNAAWVCPGNISASPFTVFTAFMSSYSPHFVLIDALVLGCIVCSRYPSQYKPKYNYFSYTNRI